MLIRFPGRRARSLALAGLALLGLTALPCDAATFHVSPAGDDAGGDGSPSSPWREIRRALLAVQPGDTVLCADGAYRGFTIDGLGSALAPITLKAEGDGAEILPTTDRGGQYDPDNIAVWNSTNIVIDGFRSFHADRAAVRIVASNRVTVRNGVYGDNGVWAIVTTHSDDAVVEGCDLFGSREQHGIYFANGGDRPVARGNRIHHNFGSGIRAYGDIDQGGDGLITGALFEGNFIHGNYGGAGMNLNAFQDAVIRNNVIRGNHSSSGIALFLGEGNIGVGGIAILHNTIDVPADGKYPLRILGTQGTITLRNNVLVSRSAARGIFSFGSPADAANTDSDSNAVAGTLFVSDDNEATRKPWADWVAAGHESASLVATPASLFADERDGNDRPGPASPAVDAGVALPSVTGDFDGVGRPQGAAPDLGAWELVASPGCGDGLLQPGLGEQCDDGNLRDGECCSAACLFETAGSACLSADACVGAGACDGAGLCVATAPPSCGGSWGSGRLAVDETVAGQESLLVELGGGPELAQADFGDPSTPAGTTYTLCVYDDAGALAGRLEVDRAGDLCGRAPCWKGIGRPPRGRGFRYKDRELGADGLRLAKLAGGAAGKSKVTLSARNDVDAGANSMPTGIAAALAGSAGATVAIFPGDAPRCFSAVLDQVVSGGGAVFEARR